MTIKKLGNELTSTYPDVWHYVPKIYSPTHHSYENLPPDVWRHVGASTSFRALHGQLVHCTLVNFRDDLLKKVLFF